MLKALTSIERWILAYVFIFVVLGVYLAIFNTPYFDQTYTLEDGFLEWLTVVALSATAVICTQRAVCLAGQRSAIFILVTALAALLFWFGAGEEVSWGQRLFNIHSSQFFQANNAQGETNLHNLVVGQTKVNKLVFGKLLGLVFAMYFFILTPLYHKNKWVAQWVNRWGIPIPKSVHLMAYFLVLLAVEVLIHHFSMTPKRGELTEFSVAFIMLLNFCFPVNDAIYTRSYEKSL